MKSPVSTANLYSAMWINNFLLSSVPVWAGNISRWMLAFLDRGSDRGSDWTETFQVCLFQIFALNGQMSTYVFRPEIRTAVFQLNLPVGFLFIKLVRTISGAFWTITSVVGMTDCANNVKRKKHGGRFCPQKNDDLNRLKCQSPRNLATLSGKSLSDTFS